MIANKVKSLTAEIEFQLTAQKICEL